MADQPSTRDQLSALVAIGRTIVDVVEAGPEWGVPSGTIYAAMMGVVSLDRYNQFIDALVNAGLIARRGDCLVVVKS